jgi:hypothetical protein
MKRDHPHYFLTTPIYNEVDKAIKMHMADDKNERWMSYSSVYDFVHINWHTMAK